MAPAMRATSGTRRLEQHRAVRARNIGHGEALDRRIQTEEALRGEPAAISAPKPAVRLSSCTIRQRWVFSTEARTAAWSHGESVRRSRSSTSTCDAGSGQLAALDHRAPGDHRELAARAHDARLPERHDELVARDRGDAPRRHRAWRDARRRSPDRCRAAPRAAARPHPRAFDGIATRQPMPCTQATSLVWLCQGSPHLKNPPGMRTTIGAAKRLCVRQRIVPQSLSCSAAGSAYLRNWISAHRQQPRERHADRAADDALLGQAGVEHARRAVFLLQSRASRRARRPWVPRPRRTPACAD